MIRYLSISIFLVFMVFGHIAYAQQNDAADVVQDKRVLDAPPAPQSDLERALEQVNKPPEEVKTKTGIDYANEHFIKCVGENKPNYTTEVQEYMCGCTSAKIADFLSQDEMKTLHEESKKADSARMNYLANVYSPCMKDVMKEITLNSCKNSEYLKRHVVMGKKKICDCMDKSMKTYMKHSFAKIIERAVMQDPLTTDPLHTFLGSEDYIRTNAQYIQNCHSAAVYK